MLRQLIFLMQVFRLGSWMWGLYLSLLSWDVCGYDVPPAFGVTALEVWGLKCGCGVYPCVLMWPFLYIRSSRKSVLLQFALRDCSICSCNFGASMGGGELSIFLFSHLYLKQLDFLKFPTSNILKFPWLFFFLLSLLFQILYFQISTVLICFLFVKNMASCSFAVEEYFFLLLRIPVTHIQCFPLPSPFWFPPRFFC